MDFVLVLILAYLSAGQSNSEVTDKKWNSCYKICPPGYYKVDDCDDPGANYRCEKCGNDTFTEIENFITKCLRCSHCGNHEEIIKPCTSTSNVVCDCQVGYFKSDQCQPCNCNNCKKFDEHPEFKNKCQPCQSCLKDPECTKKCPANSFPPTNSSTAATTSTTTAATTAARTTTSNNTSNPVVNPVPRNLNDISWLLLVVVLVTLLLFLGLLLLFARSPFRYPDSLCWCVNKDLEPPLEDPNFNEQSSHQGGSPNTLTLNISENTPMMTLSQIPARPEYPAHISPVDTEHKATTQQSDRWTAIVLYAIIKEVPLRRWKEFLRLLSVTDQQLERVELEAGLGLGSMERQYQMLRLWSQCSSASLNDVFSALHYMDLSGCAQQLQESLEKLQCRPELKQGFTACRSYTEHGFNGAFQDT
ncbi:LOW QUALITY PROTEIN: tumor necrosis factor receptor superfamily member 1A [Cebidichthys violaceus]|uniref:LOW QUALITY PROTEIN: tumor necrosis factor receptor superfamily member 1A n=1 Tax=Cebidichthys violaceus TaxID=271503 RepID=UPI0035CBD6C5